MFTPRIAPLIPTLRRLGIPLTRFLLTVHVRLQVLSVWEKTSAILTPLCRYRVSTSRFGIGQVMDSNQTPLGLHRIAQKIGGGQPSGTVFRGRVPIGFAWQGLPDATIVHRIFWLEGLE